MHMQDTINILSFEFEFNFNLDGSRQILSHVQTINKYFYNHRYILRQLCQPCMAMPGADAAHAANACRIRLTEHLYLYRARRCSSWRRRAT